MSLISGFTVFAEHPDLVKDVPAHDRLPGLGDQ